MLAKTNVSSRLRCHFNTNDPKNALRNFENLLIYFNIYFRWLWFKKENIDQFHHHNFILFGANWNCIAQNNEKPLPASCGSFRRGVLFLRRKYFLCDSINSIHRFNLNLDVIASCCYRKSNGKVSSWFRASFVASNRYEYDTLQFVFLKRSNRVCLLGSIIQF